jgi:hypothetical protein
VCIFEAGRSRIYVSKSERYDPNVEKVEEEKKSPADDSVCARSPAGIGVVVVSSENP